MRLKRYLGDVLVEKQIIIHGTKGKRYGNIIFLAGGGASGKGFATSNFLEGDIYKIRDIDWYKDAFIKLDNLKKKYPEVRNLDLSTPGDVGKLHAFVAQKKIKSKTLNLLLADLKESRLPNILFDITFQYINKVVEPTRKLIELGYNPKDINLVWVLTNYKVAVAQNREPSRGRIVPEDILLQSHEGAALNMHDLVTKGVKGLDRKTMDGEINVILGGKDHTVFWTDKEGKPIKTKPSADAYRKIYGKEPPEDFLKPQPIIKDFKYLKVKQKGKPVSDNKEVQHQLYTWIMQNIPKTHKTAHIWKDSALKQT